VQGEANAPLGASTSKSGSVQVFIQRLQAKIAQMRRKRFRWAGVKARWRWTM
jgi:hypothetical protein